MEDAVVKTIAGFLNTDGGTLFMGVDDRGQGDRAWHTTRPLVKPPNVDGFVNWLTTHLIAALTHTAVMRTRTRIDEVEACRSAAWTSRDPRSPVMARMSDKAERSFGCA